MSLTRADLETVAQLARLSLTEDEILRHASSLKAILEFVGQLDAVETAGIEPMAHPLPGLSQRLRADEITETDQHAKYQAIAPRVAGGLYLVPKVIE